MAKETDDKLEKLAKESSNNFKKLDELEKEYKLDESPDAENEQGEETELEKKLDKVPPVWAPNTNPTNRIVQEAFKAEIKKTRKRRLPLTCFLL